MKIAFCTCVQLGLSCIESIISNGGEFDLFLTLNDNKSTKKSGRIYLDDIAKRTNTPLFKINHINDIEVSEIIKKFEIDWLFIIGWSQIANKDLLLSPKKGVIGAHPTLLPEGRGRAAVPWSIIKGLKKTGVTFFKMDEGVDTGPILDQYEIPLSIYENATDLYEKVNVAHISLINQIWPKLMNDSLIGRLQDDRFATYWDGRTPKDGELKISMEIDYVDKLVRATTRPYPGAYLQLEENKFLKIWKGSKSFQENSYKIDFQNGVYYATDFQITDEF
jgi:methionyl-tRNA formyltransferase